MLSCFAMFFLLLSVALAVPSSRYEARCREGRQSQLNNRLDQLSANGIPSLDIYSVNWAGAFWDKPNGTFTSVSGTFTVPMLSGENDAAASAWVGIDGDTCINGILQTGVEFIRSDGQVSYAAWYEWYPAPAYYFSGINISAGDLVKLSVAAYSTTSGIATVENLTNGQTASRSINSTFPLCQQNAEWIVEDFQQGGGLATFANFGTVSFTNAEATGAGIYTPSGATIINIQQSNQVLTSVSINGSSVTIDHV